jgi:hypothetical protein
VGECLRRHRNLPTTVKYGLLARLGVTVPIERVEEAEEFEEVEYDSPRHGESLEQRMARHQRKLATATSERFQIPGWPFLYVELRRIHFQETRKIQQRNSKVRPQSLMDVYNIADQVLKATLGLYEVVGENSDGTLEYRDTGDTWVTLASRLENCPDNPSPRQAFLFLVQGDERIQFLAQDWGEWSAQTEEEAGEEGGRDFVTTG